MIEPPKANFLEKGLVGLGVVAAAIVILLLAITAYQSIKRLRGRRRRRR